MPGSETPLLIITPTPSCPMTREHSVRSEMSARSNQSNSTTLSSCTVKSNPSKIRLNFKLDSPEEMERKTRNLMRSSRKYKPSFFGVSEDNMYRRVKVKHEPPYRPESMMRIIHRKTPSTPGSPLRHKTNSTL